METKLFQLEDAVFTKEGVADGYLKCVFATLDVTDKDGDVVMHGSVGNQNVHISPLGHAVWDGHLPIGKGVAYEDGNLAVMEGMFNLEIQAGRDCYSAIKFAPELYQFSWGFQATRKPGSHAYIERTKIWEVSPVLIGAGVNTRVLAVKSTEPEPEETPEEEIPEEQEAKSLITPASINAVLEVQRWRL